MQKAINFNDVAIVSVIGSDYRIQFWYMSKDDATNVLVQKMSDKTTYYQRSREKIFNRAKGYNKNNKERVREKV